MSYDITPKEAAERIVSLTRAKKVGEADKWMGHCPTHDDQNPSLSISIKDNVALVKCFSGCQQTRLVDHFKSLDAWPRESIVKKTTIKPVEILRTESVYDDEAGTPHLKATRIDFSDGTKDIFFSHLENGHWISGGATKPIRPFNYSSWKDSDVVYITEGEKCCAALIQFGFPATCTPNGSNAWKASYAKFFYGKTVYIMPDNDVAGRIYADSVASDLEAHCLVMVVELPGLEPTQDVFNYLAINNLEALLLEIKNAYSYDEWKIHYGGEKILRELNLIRMSDVEERDVNWLIEPYIAVGEVTMVEGDPGCGKSWFCLHLAHLLSQGGKFLDKSLPKSVSLLASCEDDIAVVIKKRLKSLGADDNYIFAFPNAFALDETGLKNIEMAIKRFKPKLLVVNPILSYMGNRDANNAKDVRPLLDRLMQIARDHQISIVVVRHLKKGDDKAISKGSGSIQFSAAVRSVLLLGKDPKDKESGAIFQTKNNLGPMGGPIGYSLKNGRFELSAETTMTPEDLLVTTYQAKDSNALDEAKDFLEQELANGPLSRSTLTQLADGAGISNATLRRAKKVLGVQHKKVENDWLWSLPKEPAAPIHLAHARMHKNLSKLSSMEQVDFLDSDGED